jgi:hypothetical protein
MKVMIAVEVEGIDGRMPRRPEATVPIGWSRLVGLRVVSEVDERNGVSQE